MAETLGTLVDRTISQLAQFGTNQPQYGTFKGWTLDGADKVGIKLDDVSDQLSDALVELNTEVVFVSSFDPDGTTDEATCPAWFRQQLGTPLDDAVTTNTRVTINPVWTRYGVAQQIVAGINALSPALFAAKEVELTSTTTKSNYDLGVTDVDSILKVTLEDFGPSNQHLVIGTWNLDPKNTDGKRYLQIKPVGVAGRTIRVTYAARPVVPDPATLSATWASTGLPDSAADLPVLYALYTLAPLADLAKYQSHSIAQSDSNRFVQTGSSTAISRRLEEMFRARLDDERKKLRDLYPPRPHKTLNG